jgi:hypothetical protein
VYLPERLVVGPVNDWRSGLFDEDHRTETADLLAGSSSSTADDVRAEHARRRVSTAETQIRRLQDAIKAGANPVALIDADVEALVDHLGGLSSALAGAQPEHLEAFYRDFGLSMVYDPYANAVELTIRPHW